MPMKYLSLGELGFSDTPLEAQYVTVRTGPGDQDFVNVLLGDFRTFVNVSVNQRIDDLETQIGGATGPSIWPAAKTLTLTGAVTGSVSFDGSVDFSLATSIADGSLSVAKTNGLQGLLDGKLPSGANAVSASKLMTARTISLTGLITGSTSFDGSGNVTLATVMADNTLSIAKTNGLQGLLDGKMAVGTGGLGGVMVDAGTGWNTINTTGFYRMGGTTSDGAPITGADHDVIHLQASNGDASQISFTTSALASFRVKDDAATWSPWQTFYHTGNLNPTALQYLPLSSTQYNAGSGLDCNTLAAGTKAWVAASLANTPGASSTYWYIETLLYGSGSTGLLQRAFGTSADETWFRTHNGTSWGTWRRIWNASNFTPSSKLDTNANAASASKLFTARTISLTGDMTGSTSFDGSGNVSLATTLAAGVAAGNLGYTPVQQGTGIGQLGNNVKIGWKTGSLLGVTVDATDIGNVAFQSWVGANFLSLGAAAGKANVNGQVFTGPIGATNFSSGDAGSVDLNTVTTAGFYRFQAANANLPSGINYGQLLVMHGAQDTIAQIASDYGSANLAWRSGNPPDVGGSGAWGVWRKLWHDGNLDPTSYASKVNPTMTGNVTLSGASETNYRLASTGQRVVGLISTQTPRVGLYDISNSKWMLRFESDNNVYFDNGGLTVNCVASTDTLQVNTPGSSPAGSNVVITSPGSSPGITGQYGTSKRRDIIFGSTSLGIAVSSGTGGVGQQYTFAENGTLTASDFAISSDRRLKRDIRTLKPKGELRPVSYTRKTTGERELGFIAQEVQSLYPEVVEIGEDGKLVIRYPRLSAVLSAELCAERQARQVLERKHTALNAEVKILKRAVQRLLKEA